MSSTESNDIDEKHSSSPGSGSEHISEAGGEEHLAALSVKSTEEPPRGDVDIDANGFHTDLVTGSETEDDEESSEDEEEAGEGSGGEDEDEEDEEEEEDDEEPALKYERLGGITHNLLQKDSASALAYANQRLVSILYMFARIYTMTLLSSV